MSKQHDEAGLSRSIGRFFGHVWKGIATPVTDEKTERVETKREVEQRQVEGEEGTVTLRRTVIEEIETKRSAE